MSDEKVYWVRADFADGSFFNENFPVSDWEEEDMSELYHGFVFAFVDGELSCDCKRQILLHRELTGESPPRNKSIMDFECATTMELTRLTVTNPDGSALIIYENGVELDKYRIP